MNKTITKRSSSKINFIYNSLYQLLLILIPLITTPYIARTLGAEKIGMHSFSLTAAHYFVIVIMLGLANYGNRSIAYVRDDKKKLSETFCDIYYMQLLISAIVIVAYLIYALFISNNILTWVMLLYVASAALDISWLFFGLELFKFTALRSTIVKIASTAAIFIFVKTSDDIVVYSFIYALSFFLTQISLWIYVKKIIKFKKINIKHSLAHLKPNLILFIPIIAVSIYRMMDKIMLGSLSPLEQLGYYENAEKIISVPTALIVSLGTVMMPKISNLTKNKQGKVANDYLNKSIIIGAILAASMCFGIMAVADEFVPWYFGESYTPCIELFYILMPSCLFLSMADIIRTQFLIPNKMDVDYIKSVIPGAVINLIINAALIPNMGSKGASIGTLIAEFTVCALQLYFIRKKINVRPFIVNTLHFALIGIIMFIVIYKIPQINNIPLIDIVLKAAIGATLFILLSIPTIKKYNLIELLRFHNSKKNKKP